MSKTAKSVENTASTPKPSSTKIPTAMIPRELYTDIVRLAAYNKIKKIGPQSDSAILREALVAIMKHVGFVPGQTDSPANVLSHPKPAYGKKLAALHQGTKMEVGVRKTFSVSAADYEAADAFASYNKIHGLLPKNVSQLCRDALAFYVSGIEYKFRPE